MSIKLVCTLLLSVYASVLFADTDVTVLRYDEKEGDTGVTHMRYLIGEHFLRIDEGNPDDDFILFDVARKKIFSVDHYDKTLMIIDHEPWDAPRFDFDRRVDQQALDNAPKIAGKTVHRYRMSADNKVCTEVHYVPGMLPARMGVMQLYQQVLSGQLVKSLSNTPKELHTPCFLADQIYNNGDYYALGLPVQIRHSRGYTRVLTDFRDDKVADELFVLPKGYREYQPYGEPQPAPQDRVMTQAR